MTEVVKSTCENPQFPNWIWRYNRNKKLLRFEPWFTRVERLPPQYRNMGLPDNFRFHPVNADEKAAHFQQLGANYAHDLVNNRQAGFGNASLGKTPGPAPPRLIISEIRAPYPRDELYKVNEIHNISPGMSLLDYTYLQPPASDASRIPLNPSQYLELALNQPQAFPGTFPHYNAPIPSISHRCARICYNKNEKEVWSPLQFWLERKRIQARKEDMQRKLYPREYLPPIYQPPCNAVTMARFQEKL